MCPSGGAQYCAGQTVRPDAQCVHPVFHRGHSRFSGRSPLCPLAGGMVGFSADFVGCLFSGLGYNPLFCVPPILYGVFGGVFRRYLSENVTIWRLLCSFLPPVVLGSILYQSVTLSYIYFKGPFLEGLVYYLSTRSVQFAITMVLDAVILYMLFRSGIFQRMGYWPIRSTSENQ